MLLFSLLIAGVGAATTTGIGSSPSPSPSPSSIKHHCGSDGVVPNSYMVTLKTPTGKDRSAPTSTGLNTNDGDLSYLIGWFQQYEQDHLNRRKLEAGSKPTRANHYFIQTQLAVAIEASNDVRQPTAHGPTLILTTQGSCRARPVLCAYLTVPRTATASQVAMSMATDPAVLSVEPDCYRHIDASLPESGNSSPGHDSPDLYDQVARRLSVQADAPWGIDRIDTDGEPSRLAALA